MKKRSITILYNSPVILTFALLSLLTLALGKLTGGWTTQNLFCVYRSPLTDLLTYPRFFLHVLGNPDFAACCTNIVIMLAVGPMAEERFGSKRLLLAIAVTALVTGLVLWFFFPNAALMGASGAALRFEDVRAEKDYRNYINRRSNCETANIDKTVTAGLLQLQAIERIEERMPLSELPAPLYEAARLRMQYPDATLQELADLAEIGKSGMNHRFARLLALAKEFEGTT